MMALDSDQIFKQIDDPSLREQIARKIRRAIVAGLLKPGDRLVETTLAKQMGTSRAPVREAIRLLEEEGYVVIVPRKGSFVITLTRQDIEEIFTLRTALESLAIELMLARIDLHPIEALEALVEEMRQAAENNDLAQVVDRDHAFHLWIVNRSHNSRLIRTWLQMSSQLRLFLSIKDRLYRNLNDVVDTHDPIIKAIRAGDLELAKKALVDHIVDAGKMVLDNLEGENEGGTTHAKR
jgi:DNA-binding GntR family transcriptional regulator